MMFMLGLMSSCTDTYPKMALLPHDRGTTFKEDRSNGSWEICDRIVGKEKEKNGQIKEQISNMWLIFYKQYNLSLPNFVPNFKILSQVVPEKSLTEKKLTDRYTNIFFRKGKNNIPLNTSYAGGIMML